MFDKLKEIEERFNSAADYEGELYKWKGLRNEDVEYLISEVKRLRNINFYSTEGAALFVKGELKLGIHPNNLENNFKALEDGSMKINWRDFL